jgi:hypothetical protein
MNRLLLLVYFLYVWYERFDPNPGMMRTDEYHGRYRQHFWQYRKFSRGS